MARARISTAELREDIITLLAQTLSKTDAMELREGFSSKNDGLVKRVVGSILNDIHEDESHVSQSLKEFSPHVSVQVSLIRDVLMEAWNAKQLQTGAINVPQGVAA